MTSPVTNLDSLCERLSESFRKDQSALLPSTSVPAQRNRPTDRPGIIAHRRVCEADGVGLSHYILMENPAPRRASVAMQAPLTEEA